VAIVFVLFCCFEFFPLKNVKSPVASAQPPGREIKKLREKLSSFLTWLAPRTTLPTSDIFELLSVKEIIIQNDHQLHN
jgi:hypothetical protein